MSIIKNIEQAERLLAELKTNIIELDKIEQDPLREFQRKIQDSPYFPKYCLNVKRDVKKYFVNKYADVIYDVLANPNKGIPVSTIIEILNKNRGKSP